MLGDNLLFTDSSITKQFEANKFTTNINYNSKCYIANDMRFKK